VTGRVADTPHPPSDRPATYADSGVDIDAGERAVDLIKPMVASTRRAEVVGDLGDFGGLFRLDTACYDRPVLVAATDGVGTKLVVAQDVGRLDTIGIDLVAMCVDDLVCQGAEPLFFLDYISTGAVEPTDMADLVAGVAAGCRQVGAALLGGEMAEHAGIMRSGEFDLVGFAVGVVEQEKILGSSRVRPTDVLIGLPSPGLRCNGYTLARHVLLERAGRSLGAAAWEGAPTTLGDELLLPSVIYTPAVRAAIGAADVHAVAHITGGGYAGNIPRALPEGARAVIERGTWDVPRIFGEIRRLGNVTDEEMAKVFNLGLGMVLMVDADSADAALGALEGSGVDPVVVGRVEEGDRGVDLVGPSLWSDRT
jgi:phosphoribosylformylglycinamidine cyclo-ligase